ncbi:DUF4144 domain-containing protein [Psychromonas sp.]|nr:DUF4144 domain-containing protein [Psychromonas sp.]
MVTWPCLLKLDGDDELIYLHHDDDLLAECRDLIFSDTDVVIDSLGVSYLINEYVEKGANKFELISAEHLFSIEQVIMLIRAHEFNEAEVCLTKIYFETISDAIKSLVYSR